MLLDDGAGVEVGVGAVLELEPVLVLELLPEVAGGLVDDLVFVLTEGVVGDLALGGVVCIFDVEGGVVTGGLEAVL